MDLIVDMMTEKRDGSFSEVLLELEDPLFLRDLEEELPESPSQSETYRPVLQSGLHREHGSYPARSARSIVIDRLL